MIVQDWNPTGDPELDRVGLLVSPISSPDQHIVEMVDLHHGTSAKGVIHRAEAWQEGDMPDSGSMVNFHATDDPLFEIEVWRKYYFLQTIGPLQLYYGSGQLDDHKIVQERAIHWLRQSCGIGVIEVES